VCQMKFKTERELKRVKIYTLLSENEEFLHETWVESKTIVWFLDGGMKLLR
jgi:hypothetical protein